MNVCKHCRHQNPEASRFCNQCGEDLPPRTHKICPNCQQRNPIDLLYCDHCGSKLVQTGPLVNQTDEEPEEAPPVESKRAFSLPARPIGHTEQLDLDEITPENLPDWLTGDDDLVAEPSAQHPISEQSEDLTTASSTEPDTEPEDEALHDFAKWLSEEEQSPETSSISPSDKEMPDWVYNDTPRGSGMLSPDNTTKKGGTGPLPPIESETDLATNQALPDWLTDMAPPGSTPLASQEADETIMDALGNTSADVPDWLSDVLPPTGKIVGSGALTNDSTVEDLIGDLPSIDATPDWLTDMAQSTTSPQTDPDPLPTSEDESPDWLADLLPPPTLVEQPASTDEVMDSLIQDMSPPQEMPEWLEDVPTAPDEPADLPADPDWLADLLPPSLSTGQLVPSSSSAGSPRKPAPDLPDWLEDLIGGDEANEELSLPVDLDESEVIAGIPTDTPPTPDLTDELELDLPTPTSAELPDWLTDMAPPVDKVEPLAELELDLGKPVEDVPDWLGDLETITEESIPSPDLPSPSSLELPESPIDLPSPVDEVDFVEEPTIDLGEPIAEAPDWLDELGTISGDAGIHPSEESDDPFTLPEPTAEPPDWLDEIAVAPTSDETPIPEPEPAKSLPEPILEEPIPDLEQPPWDEEDVPDWLAQAPPEITDLVEEEETPDWLDALVDTGQLHVTPDHSTEVPSLMPAVQEQPPDPEPDLPAPELEPTLDDPEPIVAETSPPPDEEISPPAYAPSTDEDTDWLSELEEMAPQGTGILSLAEESSPDEHLLGDLAFDEAMPDWLSDMVPPESQIVPEDEVAEVVEELPAVEPITPISTEPDLDFPDFDELSSLNEPEVPVEEMGDWLAEMSATGLLDADKVKEDKNVDEWLEEIGIPDSKHFSEEPAPPVEPKPIKAESIGDYLEGDVPAETPDWLQELMSGTGLGSETDESVIMPATDTPTEIPSELASAELPDWLQDNIQISAEQHTQTPDTGSLPEIEHLTEMEIDTGDLPDWLAEVSTGELRESSVPATSEWDLTEEDETNTQDSHLLDNDEFSNLEKAETVTPVSESDIPEWVQELKPTTPSLAGQVDLRDEPIQEIGPLIGMRGVIDIEPTVATPPEKNIKHPEIVISESHQQQAAALKQLTQEPTTASPTPTKKSRSLPSLGKLLFLLLLLALALLAWFLPNILDSLGYAGIIGTAPELNDAYTTIVNAGNQPVLVAFDYLPESTNELNPLAETVLGHLQTQNSPTMMISQSAFGTDLSQKIVTGKGIAARNIGFLPGEQEGLQLLANCLSTATDCQTSTNDRLNALKESDPVALLVVLTDDKTTLTNWVEQLNSTNIPIVAGVTEALEPVTQPYYTNAQLSGVVGGSNGVIAYQGKLNNTNSANQIRLIQLTLLVVIVLLLIVSLVRIIAGKRQATN